MRGLVEPDFQRKGSAGSHRTKSDATRNSAGPISAARAPSALKSVHSAQSYCVEPRGRDQVTSSWLEGNDSDCATVTRMTFTRVPTCLLAELPKVAVPPSSALI